MSTLFDTDWMPSRRDGESMATYRTRLLSRHIEKPIPIAFPSEAQIRQMRATLQWVKDVWTAQQGMAGD